MKELNVKYTTNIFTDISKTLNTALHNGLELKLYTYIYVKALSLTFPVGCDCRLHRLHLCSGVKPLNVCPGYDTKQSDGEVPVMLELWGMRSTPSLPLLLCLLWPKM